ncbi:BMP family ABC transporter substrate-binding protein [Falsirhodobacter sp. 20TX0035]|nr:BMP family ABC transporter substrate-binding protein [Falsirhodobacter sp. 20TX0035]MDB6453868.1 BMP family ABC transporter substrate-binding protein [Falsirhodobacter sp. 20TX0035]
MADPALIFDLGGKFDKSFNEAAYTGAQRWAEETGGKYREIEMQSEAQREQALRRLAQSGSNPIVMTGFSFSDVLTQVAADYPDTKFVIIDSVVEAPNVRSVVFSEEEGSYLAGLMAGMASKTGTVGFIGGMDIPLIRKFGCGYAQGAVAANPQAKVLVSWTGSTPAAWNDPVRGGELARAQIGQGADVIYHGAGGTGIGILQAAADEGILSIGVDSNQNMLHPGQVLTSMVKSVDVAVEDAFKQGEAMEGGTVTLGLAQQGVVVAMDENNAALVTPEMKAAVEDATQKIIAGEIAVHDYMTDDTCPVAGF